LPGWYIHLEVANAALKELQSGKLSEPTALFQAPWDAPKLSNICYRWRNYYALGAIGPDLFYLLPDYQGRSGDFIRNSVDAVLDTWEWIDPYKSAYWSDVFGVLGGDAQDMVDAITGGLYTEVAGAIGTFISAVLTSLGGLLARCYDWFGILSTGVSRGYAESGFFWSDMFHYRATSRFPQVMFTQAAGRLEQADEAFSLLDRDRDNWGSADWTTAANQLLDAEAAIAFAVGWMTHCGTDTVGHGFTNAKCGGPYRGHWLRHHLCENHMDALAYLRDHTDPAAQYGELDTSALHFRIALRQGDVLFPDKTPYPDEDDPNYKAGRFVRRLDNPMYDYTAGFPKDPVNSHGTHMYPEGHTATETHLRLKFFDIDPPTPATFPRHWPAAMRQAMDTVFQWAPPQVLTHDPVYGQNLAGTAPGGLPTDNAFWEMYEIAFRYLRMASSSGLDGGPPPKPESTVPYPMPTAPGADEPDDDGRGEDPAEPADESTSVLQDILHALAHAAYLFDRLVHWLLTTTGLNTFLAETTEHQRQIVYDDLLMPAYNLKMAARRVLVEQGFIAPKAEEIDAGLCTLGLASNGRPNQLIADLNDPTGFAAAIAADSDLSGRNAGDADGRDDRYPRDIVSDPVSLVAARTGLNAAVFQLVNMPFTTVTAEAPSEFLSPWVYPAVTPGGHQVPREEDHVLVGPFAAGTDAQSLLDRAPVSLAAQADIEAATTPEETRRALLTHLPSGHHLGAPLNYTLSLISRLTSGAEVPDFNLDADRGYGWKCWAWQRVTPDPAAIPPDVYEPDLDGTGVPGRFTVLRPISPPQGWNPRGDATHANLTDTEVAQQVYHRQDQLNAAYLP